ncbi:MAG: zf-HC2 domain-containing protein [Chloroflexota bacterium]|nr:zf-HC2 domain-containing protein [Chloroflexota bacterium]
MSKHPEPRDLLAAYVDGALDPTTQATLTVHLVECPDCQADVAVQRDMKRLLAPATLPAALPADLTARVRGQVYGPALRPVALRPRFAWPNLRGWFAVPALAVLLLLLMVGMSVAQVGPFTPRPSLAAEVAAMSVKDHIMCEESGQIPRGIPGDMPAVSAKLGELLGMPVGMPQTVPSGYQFKGGHELNLGEVNGGHLIWTSGATMLSLYQAHDPGGDPPAGWQPLTQASQAYWLGPAAGGEHALFWRAAGHLFLLAGTLPQADLLTLAGSVHP